MADRTVRAIFEARVSGARKGMTDLAKDVTGAGKKVDSLTKDLKTLDAAKVKQLLKSPIIVDLRNVYSPADMVAAGFTYSSIGRPVTARGTES